MASEKMVVTEGELRRLLLDLKEEWSNDLLDRVEKLGRDWEEDFKSWVDESIAVLLEKKAETSGK